MLNLKAQKPDFVRLAFMSMFVYYVEINLGSQLRYSNLLFALDMYQEKMESMVIDW